MSQTINESIIQRLTMQNAAMRIALRDVKFKAQNVAHPESQIIELVDETIDKLKPEAVEVGMPCFNCNHTPTHADITVASLQDKLAMMTTVKVNVQSDYDKNFGANRG